MMPRIGDRITDTLAPRNEGAVREWIGAKAFVHWAELRRWIDASYPQEFSHRTGFYGPNTGGFQSAPDLREVTELLTMKRQPPSHSRSRSGVHSAAPVVRD